VSVPKAPVEAEVNLATTPNPQKFMLQGEVARMLYVSERTLERHRWQGTGIPYHKLCNGRVLYRRSDVEEFLTKSRVAPIEMPTRSKRFGGVL
jgi:hypothetical protein